MRGGVEATSFWSVGPEESDWDGPPEAAKLANINESFEDYVNRLAARKRSQP